MAHKIKSVDKTQQEFTDKFNYFSRYKNDSRFGLAWWYAFARAGLLFFTILGYLLEGVNVANHYVEFVRIVSFFSALIAPVSISLASLVVFSLIVGVIAYHKFKEDFKKCIDSYKVTQKGFLSSVKNRIIIEQAFAKAKRGLPYNYYNPVDHTKLKLPEEGKIQKLMLLVVHGVVAAVGWLQALSVFTGLHVFSMTAIAGSFIPPLALSLAFILLVAAVVTYIEGIVEVSQKYHRKKQHRLQVQFTSQFNLVMASLGQNADLAAQKQEKARDLAIEGEILYNMIPDEQRFDQDGCVIFSQEEMRYALAYIDISRENIGNSSASAVPSAVQINPAPFTARVSISPLPRKPIRQPLSPEEEGGGSTHRSFVLPSHNTSHPVFSQNQANGATKTSSQSALLQQV